MGGKGRSLSGWCLTGRHGASCHWGQCGCRCHTDTAPSAPSPPCHAVTADLPAEPPAGPTQPALM